MSNEAAEIRNKTIVALELDAKQAHVFDLARQALAQGGWLATDGGLGRSVNRRVVAAIKNRVQATLGGDPVVSYDDQYGMLTIRIWGVVGLDYDHSVDAFLGYDGAGDDGGYYKSGLTAAWFDQRNARHGAAARARLAAARAWLATDGPEKLAEAHAALAKASAKVNALNSDLPYSV